MKIKKGFTFIEIIVVMAVIGLVLPALFAIIFSVLKQQNKIYHLSEVKRQGDGVLNSVENTVRNYAVKIYSDSSMTTPQCSTASSSYSNSSFYIQDKYGNRIKYYIDSNAHFASDSALLSKGLVPDVYLLTSDKVAVSNFSISCYRRGAFSLPVIAISYDLNYLSLSNSPEDAASLHYSTRIGLRNY